MKALLIFAVGISVLAVRADAQSRIISPRDLRALTTMAMSTPIQFPTFTDEQKALIVNPKNAAAPADRDVFTGLPPNAAPMDQMGFKRLKTFTDRNRQAGWLWGKWLDSALKHNDNIEKAKVMLSAVDKAEERDLQRRSVEAQEDIARRLRDQMIIGR